MGRDKSKWKEKMELYKSFGWSEEDIVSAFKKQPQIMILSKEKMRRLKSKWKEKMELYKSFGWSEEDIVSAFKKQPQIMILSKEKMRRLMDFFMNETGWGLSFVSRYPNLLLLSFEKTIMLRYSVTRILFSHGLLSRDVNFVTIFLLKEEKFIEKYVIKYQDKVPQVMLAYQCKM